MAIVQRRAADRGTTRLPWLDGRHSFSFGDYHDPSWMQWSALRVLNDDRIAPGGGFGTHPHRDMEILTWVLEGALAHQDSMGTGAVIRPGEAQLMSAGTGITHSEFNPSREETAHLLQIWILPERKGIKPRYDQKSFPENSRRGKFRPVASPDGRDGSLVINQDVTLYLGSFAEGSEASYALAPGRHAWLQVARGAVDLNGKALKEGDGASLTGEPTLKLRASEDSEVLLFDLR
jgi:hypothetical protein